MAQSEIVPCLVFFRMTRFRYFAVGEYPLFICDTNLVNREAKVGTFSSLLSSCIVKNNKKSSNLAKQIKKTLLKRKQGLAFY